ncbi:hypothetical protein BHE74_00037988 [Ensete ventricosum]|nr:hypothetical protein GW17_00011810 [Ensete ventricosum]RWW55381.1 hypothetical protein BHE74_00037988 [Ensete ventricosum]RZS10999.1 hypothetical protein BHM03_00042281 [Ensete ventricosum]
MRTPSLAPIYVPISCFSRSLASMEPTSVDLDLSIGSVWFSGNPAVKAKDADDDVTLEAELDSANEENKVLKETLAAMVAKYGALRRQMTDLLPNHTSSEGGSVSSGTKDAADTGMRVGEGEHNPEVSKLCVRTDPSDSSLVSPPYFLVYGFCFRYKLLACLSL